MFTQPSVAAAIGADYVAVKVNADNFPATARQYGVTALPTTVIALPDGRPLETVQKRMDAAQYVGSSEPRCGRRKTASGRGLRPDSRRPGAAAGPARAARRPSPRGLRQPLPRVLRQPLPRFPPGRPAGSPRRRPASRPTAMVRRGRRALNHRAMRRRRPLAQPPAPAPVAPAYGAAAAASRQPASRASPPPATGRICPRP